MPVLINSVEIVTSTPPAETRAPEENTEAPGTSPNQKLSMVELRQSLEHQTGRARRLAAH